MPPDLRDRFLVRGELTFCEAVLGGGDDPDCTEEAAAHPKSYRASDLVKTCHHAAGDGLAGFLLQELCLNPEVALGDHMPWYLPRLLECLAELHDIHATAAAAKFPVKTVIGEKINEALDYALAQRCMVVIEGNARIGKSHAAQAYAEAHPGIVRYMQVPSSNDDMSFFRKVCDALGLGGGRTAKAHELRDKAEDVLQTGDLLLILDEGHYAWPQRNLRKAVPHRINWILTQLVNMGVPVAIVTTPQFTKSQRAVEAGSGWSSEQLIGRIKHYERLPATIEEADLQAVAGHLFAGADADCIELAVAYAQTSQGYLFGLEKLSCRACYLAQKAGRTCPTLRDVATALEEGVVPSDNAIISALESTTARVRGRSLTADAEPLKPRFTPPASPVSPRATQPISMPARDTGSALVRT